MFRLPTVQEMKAGDVMLYIDLTELGEMPINNAISILLEMGYYPELKYRQWHHNGETGLGLYALLKYEHRSPDQLEDYLEEELDALAERIPTDAIRSPRKLYPKTKPVAVAA
jgi:hypothetical protein